MESQPQISLETQAHLHPMSTSVQDGDPVVVSTTPDRSEPQQSAKKTTRQWAAWTHQEEESFFTALRQVGKNFEKITRRVQSKNKDQVRHYYYRLVRRMNKLLGPGLCLDAKNSKDTNAAMLRWWSLLEKYSCKASKLHLKPRRFKIFIEALGNQLMKDRKKNFRKRPSQGENSSPIVSSLVTNHNRASGHDSRMVKLVLVDSENVQKFGSTKGSLKRNGSIGVIRSNKGDSTFVKSTRQRQKQAAYKRWEKAAIAGVSLVADAAEHLERTATDREVEHDPGTPGLKCSDPGQRDILASHNHFFDANVQTKLKLQLFPIDDTTRRALEMDNHNPHLELTLSTRKKISSVLEHLNRKWGNSSVATGNLILLPFSAHRDNLLVSQAWNQESVASAADVYTAIGSPPLFRLRYGWFFNNELAHLNLQGALASSQLPGKETGEHRNGKEMVVDLVSTCEPSTSDPLLGRVSPSKYQATAIDKNDIHANPASNVSNEINAPMSAGVRNDLIEAYNSAANVQWCKKESSDRTNNRRLEETDEPRLNNGTGMSAGEWADSLTNISIGDLLSEVPPGVNDDCIEPLSPQSDLCLQQIPFSCDSFDAAIAAHLSKHQKMVLPNTEASNAYSIWDAEETCDAFAFQKARIFCSEVSSASIVASPSFQKQTVKTSPMDSDCHVEELHDMDEPVHSHTDRDTMSEYLPDSHIIDGDAKNLSGLTDIYWPDSLGPLDLDMPSSKYLGNDLILNDSLSGLNRLIASSLDAFQNCSFLGVDKKDSLATVESRDTFTFSEFRSRGGL